MTRKILKFFKFLILPALLIAGLFLFQDHLPSQREIQRKVKDFKPVKEMKQTYKDSIDNRLEPVDTEKLKGTRGTQKKWRPPRSGEWRGPASKDPNSPWKTRKNSGWKGPGAK